MINNLFKVASTFYKASEDPLAPIRTAIDSALAAKVSPEMARVKTISWVGNTVKIDMELTPAGGSITRSQLEAVLVPAVKSVNPNYQVSVTVSSSESKMASLKNRLINKFAQQDMSNVKATIEEALKGIPGAKLLDVSAAGNQFDAKIEVPEKHSFSATTLGETLTNAIQSVAPGSKVVGLLSFTTGKTASLKKRAGMKEDAESVITTAVSGLKNIGLHSIVFQPESKHILVEVGKTDDNNINSQQIQAFLTNKVQAVAPGFTVIPTIQVRPAQ